MNCWQSWPGLGADSADLGSTEFLPLRETPLTNHLQSNQAPIYPWVPRSPSPDKSSLEPELSQTVPALLKATARQVVAQSAV